ncbi:hypothetical protein [Leptolyngbya sp. FACHB-711]|uniref:hypothetical protein n=1 Tax=unclassified Leptolyngbya TaxID=2650499 RepID=UPI001686013B|nr:hypothetical protein [Leptolyngbya sp. FACHB-711]MBD1849384.1 hypothetical protein [Cyanobacteria bacterium FACHB-502]MBD2026222.1 hypothetical protein [Leptolyngbya sp. FACHB-711]
MFAIEATERLKFQTLEHGLTRYLNEFPIEALVEAWVEASVERSLCQTFVKME